MWSNWAGNQRCQPEEVAHPSGTDELAAVVRDAASAGRRVKVAGSGHSFTGAACTTGMLVLLDRHQRLLAVDRDRAQVTVEAGITLATLNRTLALYGLALPNLGDIEYQTVAGALATGTHGTGGRHRCLAAQLVAMELVAGSGEVLQLSPDRDEVMFSAAAVSIGALGVVSAVTLQCVPAFNLHAEEGPQRVDDVIERFEELAGGNDHFEFFWMPYSPWAIVKRNTPIDGPERRRSKAREWFDDVFVQNHLFGLLGRVQARRPRWVPAINRAVGKTAAVEYVDRSDRVFTSPRRVRFYEMEYGFPRALARDVIDEVRRYLTTRDLGVGCPIEVRVTAADDIPLSMGYGRDSCFIACHVFEGQGYERYFRGVEHIMAAVDGRPHWGKLHFQDATTLGPLYPRWSEFQAVRDRLDPRRVFANAYLDCVLGP